MLAESEDGRFANEQYVYHSSPHPCGVSHPFPVLPGRKERRVLSAVLR